jgi:unsaturated rhamnogalacturonyl hydrolase
LPGKTVGLDNCFNHETHTKTGKIFHYTRDDQANSGFSQLGELFVKHGAKIKPITTSPDEKSLKDIDVYFMVDPYTTSENRNPNYVTDNDVKFLKSRVAAGGVLLLMSNDGPNCEFTHFNHLAEAFGFHFRPVTLNPVVNHQWDMGAETNLPAHPLFSGVGKIYLKKLAPIVLSLSAQPVLRDKGQVLMAETQFAKGYVLAIGDPWL